MIVGLTYNLKGDYGGKNGPEDSDAEFDSEETVENLIFALKRCGYNVIRLPYGPDLLDRLRCEELDLIFNIAEGLEGRNRESIVPAILEFLGIPYIGSDPLTLGLALDKATAKAVVAAHGIPTPRFLKAESPGELSFDGQSIYDHAQSPQRLNFPVFVKPNCEGSSKGIRNSSKVDDFPSLFNMVKLITRVYRQPALVEEFLDGREFSIGIIGNEELTVFPMLEVEPDYQVNPGEFVYSYETKSQNLERFTCPANIPQELEDRIRAIACEAHRILSCRDFSRIDVRLDSRGDPYFLEINPLPGLSQVSLFPLVASAAGVSFVELIDRIVSIAIERLKTGLKTEREAFEGGPEVYGLEMADVPQGYRHKRA
ncbi:MAG: ATP-grasp domain-containing protein [Firmicutes bacterium]|nr:ATP-grasp domain-containing protein [Bacillota bacterium]